MIAVTYWFKYEWKAYYFHSLSRWQCYMLTLYALICFERNDERNSGIISSYAKSPWHPLKRTRPKYKPDRVIQMSCMGMPTYARCETTSSIEELRLPRSIENAFPFRRTTADYMCNYSYFLFCCKPSKWGFFLQERCSKRNIIELK